MKRKLTDEAAFEQHVEKELEWSNEQMEENDMKQMWKVGKRMKKIVDHDLYSKLSSEVAANVYFVWGSMLSRLASQNDDVALAQASEEKFKTMSKMTTIEDIGPTGVTLWASAILVQALELRDTKLCTKADQMFEKAVEISDESDFEVRFQYAKALKDIVDFHIFDQASQKAIKKLIQKGIKLCEELHETFSSQIQEHQTEEIDEADDDEDAIEKQDIAEVLILHSQFVASQPEAKWGSVVELLQKARDVDNENITSLLEMNKFLLAQCQKQSEDPGKLLQLLEKVVTDLRSSLSQFGIDLESIEYSEETEEPVGPLMDALGANLLHQLWLDDKNLSKCFPLVTKYLRVAHDLDPKLGCYNLARAYALFPKQDATSLNCLEWLDTCETYGVLDDVELTSDRAFAEVVPCAWFRKFCDSSENK